MPAPNYDTPWTEKPVTFPQASFLRARNVLVPPTMTRGEASAVIASIKRTEALNPPAHTLERVSQLFLDGYLQTSRRFFGVARLPPGKTGIEALIEAELAACARILPPEHPAWAHWREHYPSWANGLGEIHAAKYYRACHATRAGLALTLDAETFHALRIYTKARGVNFSWGRL